MKGRCPKPIDEWCIGASGRNRTGTPFKARDFKSLVSTYFTTLALIFKEQVCIIHELVSLSTSCCTNTTQLGVDDRNRTCIKRICNPFPSLSGHIHTKLVLPTGFEPVSSPNLEALPRYKLGVLPLNYRSIFWWRV